MKHNILTVGSSSRSSPSSRSRPTTGAFPDWARPTTEAIGARRIRSPSRRARRATRRSRAEARSPCGPRGAGRGMPQHARADPAGAGRGRVGEPRLRRRRNARSLRDDPGQRRDDVSAVAARPRGAGGRWHRPRDQGDPWPGRQGGRDAGGLESAEFGQSKSDHLQAAALLNLRRKTWEQEKALSDKGIAAGRELLEATTSLEEAKLAFQRTSQRLALLGLSPDRIRDVVERQTRRPSWRSVRPSTERSSRPARSRASFRRRRSRSSRWPTWAGSGSRSTSTTPTCRRSRRTIASSSPSKAFRERVSWAGSRRWAARSTTGRGPSASSPRSTTRAACCGRTCSAGRKSPCAAGAQASGPQGGRPERRGLPSGLHLSGPRRLRGTADRGRNGVRRGYEVVGGLEAGERIVTTGSFLLKTELQRSQMARADATRIEPRGGYRKEHGTRDTGHGLASSFLSHVELDHRRVVAERTLVLVLALVAVVGARSPWAICPSTRFPTSPT